MEELIVVEVELNAAQAWALAQLLKRIGCADCRGLAEGQGADRAHDRGQRARARGAGARGLRAALIAKACHAV
jgi:hypothetical protein